MMRSSSTTARASARIDATVRYRGATEGVLCVARCRELSPTGLTATIDRPVFPGELVRFDLERASGGQSVVGLARVSWVGSDPDTQGSSNSIMRLRFLSLSDASHALIGQWIDEVSAVSQRTTIAGDDSSVRALGRAIADSLAPPPPMLGMPPKRGHSIPTPPGYPSPLASASAAPGKLTTPSGGLPVAPLNAALLARENGAGSQVTKLPAPSATAEVRSRLLRAKKKASSAPPAISASLAPPAPAGSVAPATLAPPLPLGALLHAPPEQTRRSSPPPAEPLVLEQPVAAEPLPAPSAPASAPAPTPRVSSSAPPPVERASLPLGGPSLPPDEAPWVPKKKASRWHDRFATKRVRGWLVLCLASVMAGAGLAYVGYRMNVFEQLVPAPARTAERGIGLPPAAPAAARTAPPEPATEPPTAASPEPPTAAAAAPRTDQPALDAQLAAQMPLPSATSPALLPAPTLPAPTTQVVVKTTKVASHPSPKPAPAKPKPDPTRVGASAAPPPSAAGAAAPPAAPAAPAAPPVAPSASLVITPAPAQPAQPATPGGSRLTRARRCLAQGNTGCVIALLEGVASTEAELELWIETLRAEGRAGEARKAMQRYVAQFPDGRRFQTYERILEHAE